MMKWKTRITKDEEINRGAGAEPLPDQKIKKTKSTIKIQKSMTNIATIPRAFIRAAGTALRAVRWWAWRMSYGAKLPFNSAANPSGRGLSIARRLACVAAGTDLRAVRRWTCRMSYETKSPFNSAANPSGRGRKGNEPIPKKSTLPQPDRGRDRSPNGPVGGVSHVLRNQITLQPRCESPRTGPQRKRANPQEIDPAPAGPPGGRSLPTSPGVSHVDWPAFSKPSHRIDRRITLTPAIQP